MSRLFPVLVAGVATAFGSFAASAATVYTGDTIQGKRVISQLDVNDLEPGKKHSFFFQGVQMGTGQHWYLPVVVAKGAKPGKKILLISGVIGQILVVPLSGRVWRQLAEKKEETP